MCVKLSLVQHFSACLLKDVSWYSYAVFTVEKPITNVLFSKKLNNQCMPR